MGIAVAVIGAFALVVAFILIIKKSIREGVGGWLAEKPVRIWLLPFLMLAYYTMVTLAVEQWSLNLFLALAVYFGLPTLLLYITGPKSGNAIAGRDLVINFSVLLWIWLLIEKKVVQTNWLYVSIGSGKPQGYPLGVHAAMIYGLIVLSGWRKFDVNCDLSFKKCFIVPIVTTFEVLGVILLLITLPTGLTQAGIAEEVKLNPLGLPLAIALPFAILAGFPIAFLGVGLVEEFLFRGAIQNLLGHRLKPIIALLIASAVFGLAHVDNGEFGVGVPNWPFVGLATIAGLGYGFVFWKTKSVVASATVHAMIDLMWVLFFARSCG